MFFSFKLKPIICFVLVVVVGAICSALLVNSIKGTNANSVINYTIVLDAGHGGTDGGCVGVNSGITEAEINLSVTKQLEKLLTSYGFNVVLTRHDSGGLYSFGANNNKLSDMQNRKTIIEKSNANMVVSIHMNSYVDNSECGAQTFYLVNDQQSKMLADEIQAELQNKLPNARSASNFADLYILKCINSPSVVVEGGFLSNIEEEKLLIDAQYQSKLAYSIFCGILKYYQKASKL